MDRLGKALQKAREQRQDIQEEALRAVHAVPPPITAANSFVEAPAPPPPSHSKSRKIEISNIDLESNRIFAQMNDNPNADIFRILRTKVLHLMQRSNLRTLAITSANYNEGKTTVALNLALSFAMDIKQTVLVVDLDLRRPNVHEYLGIEPTAGLADYFLKHTPLPECLLRTSVERLTLLPMNGTLENSSELLGTPQMATLAKELKERYADRLVIYDMPPLLAQDDVIAFLPDVDGVLLVVRDGVTAVEDVKHCLHLLSDANIIGTVLNDCPEKSFNKV
jgi:capsular exopolysaccharide synthesis family protein